MISFVYTDVYLFTGTFAYTNTFFSLQMTFHELFADKKSSAKMDDIALEGKPATTLVRVLERFSSMSGIISNGPSKKDPDTKSRVLASNIQAKVTKMVKFHRRLEVQQADTAQSLTNWAADLPHLSSREMIKAFANIIMAQRAGSMAVAGKLEQLQASFSLVNDREKKLGCLVQTRAKLVKTLKDYETRYGANASCTTLMKEKLEEIQCNLEVVEIQCIRSLSHELKDTFADYLLAIQSFTTLLSNSTSSYYECLVDFQKDDKLSEALNLSANNSEANRLLASGDYKAKPSPSCSQCYREFGITTGCAHDSSRNAYPNEVNKQIHQFAPLPIQMSNDAPYDFLDHDPWKQDRE